MTERSLSGNVRISVVRRLLMPLGLLLLALFGYGVIRVRDVTFDQQIRNAEWIRTYLVTFLDRSQHMLDFVTVDADGAIDSRSISVLSAGILAENPVFRRVMILNADARLISSYPAVSSVIDLSGIVGRIKLGERMALTVPYYSNATNRMVVSVIRGGTIAGYAVAAELNLQTLQHGIDSEQSRRTGTTVFLTDRSGNVITHSDMSYVNQQVSLGSLAPIREASILRPVTGIYRADDSLQLVSAVQDLRSGRIVVVTQDVASALAPTLTWAAVTLVAFLAFSLTVLVFFGRRLDRIVVQPLMRFAGEIETVKKGIGEVGDPPEHAYLELKRIFVSFQEMSTTIGNRERDLTRAVLENETLLREIHHRVKTISTLSRVFSRYSPQRPIRWNPQKRHLTKAGAEFFRSPAYMRVSTGVIDSPQWICTRTLPRC